MVGVDVVASRVEDERGVADDESTPAISSALTPPSATERSCGPAG
jgi:hypothetical protein